MRIISTLLLHHVKLYDNETIVMVKHPGSDFYQR